MHPKESARMYTLKKSEIFEDYQCFLQPSYKFLDSYIFVVVVVVVFLLFVCVLLLLLLLVWGIDKKRSVLKFTMNKRIDKQTYGQTDDGGSVQRLTFPSFVS